MQLAGDFRLRVTAFEISASRFEGMREVGSEGAEPLDFKISQTPACERPFGACGVTAIVGSIRRDPLASNQFSDVSRPTHCPRPLLDAEARFIQIGVEKPLGIEIGTHQPAMGRHEKNRGRLHVVARRRRNAPYREPSDVRWVGDQKRLPIDLPQQIFGERMPCIDLSSNSWIRNQQPTSPA
jgi:hypothetical protein